MTSLPMASLGQTWRGLTYRAIVMILYHAPSTVMEYPPGHRVTWDSATRPCETASMSRRPSMCSPVFPRSRTWGSYSRLSLCSAAQPLYTRFPIIFSRCVCKVTIGYFPARTCRTLTSRPCSRDMASTCMERSSAMARKAALKRGAPT